MKTMKATFNKILIAGLSLVMALVCMFTVPVRKASASTETENEISDERITSFVETVFADLVLVPDGNPLCLLVDGQFFTRAETSFNITSTTTLSDINDSAFIQSLAMVFADKLGITVVSTGSPIDVTFIFNSINMNIIIHIGEKEYINVITNNYHGLIINYGNLYDWNDYVTDTTSIYGMIVFPRVASYYSLLLSTQNNHMGNMYAYALSRNGSVSSGNLNVTIL